MRRILLVASLSLAIALIAAPKTKAAFGETRTYFSKLYAGDGGLATEAFFDFPEDLFITADGTIWVADTFNNVVRIITPQGTAETYAGTGAYGLVNGTAGVARFGMPQGIAVASDRTVYLSDTDNNVLRKIDPSGNVSTLLTGLSSPQGLALAGGALYIADTGSNTIKKYSTSTGSLTTLTSAIKAPRKIVVTPDGASLYAVDNGNFRVARINTDTGELTVIAGSGSQGYLEGTGTAAQFYDPAGIGYDPATNTLYVGDIDQNRIAMIRKINLATNATSQWVYDQKMTSVNERSSMRVFQGFLYLAGTGNVHRYNLDDPVDNNDVGGKDRYQLREGALSQALVARPTKFAFSKDRRYLYLVGAHKIVKIDRQTNELSYIIGTSVDDYVEGQGRLARFSGIAGLAVNAANDTLYVTDRFNNRLRKVDLATQTSSLVSGTGQTNTTGPTNGYAEGAKNDAKFANPIDLVLSPDEKYLYVSDYGNHRLRKVEIATGQTSLIAGSSPGFVDGKGAAAKFNLPFGIALDPTGQYLYVADRGNHALRRVRLKDGEVTTLAGTGKAGYRDALGTSAVLNIPTYVALDGDRLFFADSGSHRVRVLELGMNAVKLVSGSGERGYRDGVRLSVEFNNLGGLLVDPASETLLVGDLWNDVVRTIDINGDAPFTDPAPKVTAVVPQPLKKIGTEARISVRGRGFKHGVVVYFGDTKVRSFVENSTKLAVRVPIGKMATGWYDVRVTNLDGQSDTLAAAFGLADANNIVPEVFFSPVSDKGFLSFPSKSQRGAETVAADLDGDGVEETLASQVGGGGTIRVLGPGGTLVREIKAFPSKTAGGLTVAVGDLDGDGVKEIVAAPQDGVFEVRILTPQGKLVRRFKPLGKAAAGGILAVGDLNGDGADELIVGASRGSTMIQVFTGTGAKLGAFSAYGKSKTGVRLAVADVTGDGLKDIITVPAKGKVQVKIFSGSGALIKQFLAFPSGVKTGATIAVGDVTGDGQPEIVLGLRPGSRPLIRIFSTAYRLVKEFAAFPVRYRGGVGVSVGNVLGDGVGKIVASRLSGTPELIVYTANGRAVK